MQYAAQIAIYNANCVTNGGRHNARKTMIRRFVNVKYVIDVVVLTVVLTGCFVIFVILLIASIIKEICLQSALVVSLGRVKNVLVRTEKVEVS